MMNLVERDASLLPTVNAESQNKFSFHPLLHKLSAATYALECLESVEPLKSGCVPRLKTFFSISDDLSFQQ